MRLSVIVPVYNAAPYLRESVESVLAAQAQVQSRSVKGKGVAVEVVCVDDGSTDGSSEILEELKHHSLSLSAYPLSFTLLRQQNAGPSAARNAALEVATGEYVTFLDADDSLESGFAAALEEVVSQFGGVDVVQFGYVGMRNPYPMTRELEARERARYLEDVCCVDRLGLVTGKFYRRELLRELRFDPLVVGEDTLFAVQAVRRAQRVVMLGRDLYRYRVVDGSYSHRPFPGILPMAERMLERLREEIGPTRGYYEHALGKFRWCVASSGLSVREIAKRPLFREVLRRTRGLRAWRAVVTFPVRVVRSLKYRLLGIEFKG